ncbi:hypothetical protein OAF98_01420 [Planctomicrobium sp.]|nr:hypothetical protein [bacterium]MDB4731751.1 hypothetical protein [bacterium]MDB4743120.1 hypothetical protein [Planctomicrobium sp.]
MLSCENCLQRMEIAVEEKASLPDDVQAHLAVCSSTACQDALLEYEMLASAIPTWRDSLPVIDFTQQIVEEFSPIQAAQLEKITQSQPASMNKRRSPLPAILTVCGTLAVCLIGLLQAIPPTSSGTSSLATVQEVEHNVLGTTHVDQVAITEDAEVEAELREFGRAYGSWMQGATNKLTDTVTVVLLDEQSSPESSNGWFSELTEQIEQPFESTLKFLIEESVPAEDEQTLFDSPHQKEYFGFLWSKSESRNPLFTLMFV